MVCDNLEWRCVRAGARPVQSRHRGSESHAGAHSAWESGPVAAPQGTQLFNFSNTVLEVVGDRCFVYIMLQTPTWFYN